MKILEYIEKNNLIQSGTHPAGYSQADYDRIYTLCREKWRYTPTEISKICRIAERMKRKGFTMQEIRDTDRFELTERFLGHEYIGTRSYDKWVMRAISRYQECLIEGGWS